MQIGVVETGDVGIKIFFFNVSPITYLKDKKGPTHKILLKIAFIIAMIRFQVAEHRIISKHCLTMTIIALIFAIIYKINCIFVN